MTRPAAEVTRFHTRLLKCDLAVDECRAYWQHSSPEGLVPNPEIAFSEYWFGARSLPRVRLLLATLRERFDAWPDALRVLAGWSSMSLAVRRLICHWHLQLSDPLYRQFTGVYLPERRAEGKSVLRRTTLVQWVDDVCPSRWQISTRIQFARKLIHSAELAGLLVTTNDAAELQSIRADVFSLTYLMYLLRTTRFEGTLLQNPYVRSLGLDEDDIGTRLRKIPAIGFRREGALQEFNWQHDTLIDWARGSGLLIGSSGMSGEVA